MGNNVWARKIMLLQETEDLCWKRHIKIQYKENKSKAKRKTFLLKMTRDDNVIIMTAVLGASQIKKKRLIRVCLPWEALTQKHAPRKFLGKWQKCTTTEDKNGQSQKNSHETKSDLRLYDWGNWCIIQKPLLLPILTCSQQHTQDTVIGTWCSKTMISPPTFAFCYPSALQTFFHKHFSHFSLLYHIDTYSMLTCVNLGLGYL